MYLVSRFFSSSDVAFISYISLNFVFGLCAVLVTLLPRLLAIISKVQVSIKPLRYVTHKWDVCTHIWVYMFLYIDVCKFIHMHREDFFQQKNLRILNIHDFSVLVYTLLLVTILNFNLFIKKKKKKCCNNRKTVLIETLTFSRPLSCNWHIMGAVLVHWIDYMHCKMCLYNTDIRVKPRIPKICNALYE